MEGHDTAQQSKEIKQLVTRLEQHQQALNLNNREFATRYRQWLNSETSWTRLRNGTWDEKLNAARWQRRLADLIQRLESGRSYTAESYVPTMPFAMELERHVERLLRAPSDRKALVVLAPEGCGKSWSAINICDSRRNGDRSQFFYLRLRSTWRDRVLAIMQAMALQVGAPEDKIPSRQQEALINHMRAMGENVLIMDEAHNGGVTLFKLLKDLIDETPWRFVYLAFPTQYDEVRNRNTGAIAEARQFLRRCIRPIFDDYRAGIGQQDVAAFLAANGFKRPVELNEFGERWAPLLRAHYNLTTLCDALEHAERKADDRDGRKATLEEIGKAIDSLTSTAGERAAAKAAAEKKEGK